MSTLFLHNYLPQDWSSPPSLSYCSLQGCPKTDRNGWSVCVIFITWCTTRTRVVWRLTGIHRREQNQKNSYIKVDKREFVWDFSQLSRPAQKNDSCMTVKKREYIGTTVAWELMRVDKRGFVSELSQILCPGQTRTRVAWKSTSERLYESFLNSHILVKREQDLDENWLRVDKREFVWEFSQLSYPGQTRTRSRWELVRVVKGEFVWELSWLLNVQ